MSKDLVICKKDKPLTTSVMIKEHFGKRHDNVLRDILIIKERVSKEFWQLNFEESTYKSRGKEYPMYLMTKDGFTMLVMGYTDIESMKFKELYIKKFNEMERFITSKLLARNDFPQLTDNIKIMHEEPKFYHYSNEMDMINKIVTGKTAKQIREEQGLEKGTSIRPYLSSEEIYYIEKLQHTDVGMVIAIPDYYERQKALKKYYSMLKTQNTKQLAE